jgi:hypothetical protein
VKVTSGDGAFWHTAVVPLIDAVGSGLTVITAVPVCAWVQVVELASLTLRSVYVKVPAVAVFARTLMLLPTNVVTVWFDPLLIL